MMVPRALAGVAVLLVALGGRREQSGPPSSSPMAPGDTSRLAGLEALVGAWSPPAAVQASRPRYRGHVVHAYAWTVGRQAMRLREGFTLGHPDEALLDGLVYWDPATERIEFVAVAGPGPGEGRFFHGEYHLLEDGSIERIYDVFYRTLEDMPGEELGGSRRRYREVYIPITADSMDSTLEWWMDGAWRPYNRGRYAVVRAASGN